jgi:predicted DNA-binding protein YlxM (UPF0122 family)
MSKVFEALTKAAEAKQRLLMPKNYTITEAAEKLKITRAAVHLAIQKKKLRAKWVLLIDSKDLEAYQVDLGRQRSGKKVISLDR